MDEFLYTRKEIRGHINWPELTFYAEATGEQFEQLTVTTLKSYYESVCQEQAIEHVKHRGDGLEWQENVARYVTQLMNAGTIKVREFVRVDSNLNTLVVVDADTITDNEIDIALLWLEQAAIPGETFFGEPKTFTSQQIQEIRKTCNPC